MHDSPQINSAIDAVRCLYLARVAEQKGYADPSGHRSCPRGLHSFGGCGYRAKGDAERAIADFDKALDLEAGIPTYHYRDRAKLYRDIGEYEKAVASYQAAIDVDPNRDIPFFKRRTAYVACGDIYFKNLNQPEKAVAEFTKAIELDPENGELYQKRGDAYQAMGDSVGAEADYEEAKRLTEEKTPDENQNVNFSPSPGWTSPERLGLHAWDDDSVNCNTQAGNDKRRTLSC